MSEGYLVALLLCTSAELVGRTEENADSVVSMAKPAGERSAQVDPVTHRVCSCQ